MTAMLIALIIDATFGWPDPLYRRIGHPVTWLGALITRLDRALNKDNSKWRGVLAWGATLSVATAPAIALTALVPPGWAATLITGVLAWPLVAARSMYTHVRVVETPLSAADLPAARHAVSMIVGRDPHQLDQAGVARAALESLAENTSDGIIAPLFWGAVLGLPGIVAYKAINTLDSMIGHKTERYLNFGWFSARVDDWVNLPASRLTGLLFAAVSGAPRRSLCVMWRDAGAHRSPNAGWPEAALAGALNIRLSGPRVYFDRIAPEPWLNAAAPDPTPDDLARGLVCYLRAMGLVALGLGLGAVLVWGY